jgi:hypothetical protein
MVDKVGRREDEDLAHDVRVLLVAAHEPDHPPTGRITNHAFKARAHEVLELHALLDHRLPAATVEERLLHAREAPRNRQTTRSSS